MVHERIYSLTLLRNRCIIYNRVSRPEVLSYYRYMKYGAIRVKFLDRTLSVIRFSIRISILIDNDAFHKLNKISREHENFVRNKEISAELLSCLPPV